MEICQNSNANFFSGLYGLQVFIFTMVSANENLQKEVFLSNFGFVFGFRFYTAEQVAPFF